MREHRFRHCTVREFPEARYLETVFADGATVPAAPEPTPEYLARAVALGYTGDDPAWAMCRAHELLHTFLATARGWPWSSQLWTLSRGIPYDGGQEEALVLAFQCYMNLGEAGWDSVLAVLPNLRQLAQEARAVLGVNG